MKRLFRWFVYALCPVFVFWLYGLSNVFTRGYHTPTSRIIALSTVAVLLPLILIVQWRWLAALLAVVLALATWPAIILLWINDKAPTACSVAGIILEPHPV
jgi:hypothetical protein